MHHVHHARQLCHPHNRTRLALGTTHVVMHTSHVWINSAPNKTTHIADVFALLV
jgi:hypothetical protein